MKRHLHGAAAAAVVALLALSTPTLAKAAAAQSYDDGWKVVLYPVYGWLPIHRADTRLPEVPETPGGGGGGGIVFPDIQTDSSLEKAILAGIRIDKGRFSFEGGVLYAGLEGEVTAPVAKLEVNTTLADVRAGYAVIPDLYIEAGARLLALDMTATVADFATAKWEPDIFQPVVGFSWRPMINKRWRFVLHGDVGGVITSDSTTAVGTAKFEWQPAKHFQVAFGGSVMYLKSEGEINGNPVSLEQTLYGPVLGIGIPF